MNNRISSHMYKSLEKARELTGLTDLDVLDLRKHLGVPLAHDIRRWLSEQPSSKTLIVSFAGIRAVTLSVAEEVGPMLMQSVNQDPSLEHRYPILEIGSPEPAYTFGRAFSNANWSCLAMIDGNVEPQQSALRLKQFDGKTIIVLGQLSNQMERILTFADQRAEAGEPLTSDDLARLDFLSDVSPAARSKRLTELHARRLLAFRENPRNPKERLFTPAWRL
jgi:hypothetical protein